MKRASIGMAAGLGVLLIWAGYLAFRARSDLVTLDVRNMEVRDVARKIERQTWERIVVHTNVAGLVTLKVRRAPLAEVLNIVALQTGSRWTALYPLYLTRASGLKFEKVAAGELPGAGNGWQEFEQSSNWRPGGTVFGQTARAANQLVSAQFENKDLAFAALALSRFSQARVALEDHARGTVNLKLDQVPFQKAVAQVARQARRKWSRVYALQPARVMMAGPSAPSAAGAITNATPAPAPLPELRLITPPASQPAGPDRQMEAFLSTMTPEERKKAEEQVAMMQQIQALPEAERQQRMQEFAAQAKQASQADFEQRVRKRLRDGTADQRVARDRETLKRKQPPQAQAAAP